MKSENRRLVGVFMLGVLFFSCSGPASGKDEIAKEKREKEPSAVKKTMARFAVAQDGCKALLRAIGAYENEYNRAPLKSGQGAKEGQALVLSGDPFMSILLGNDKEMNPRSIVFFQANAAVNMSNGLDLDGHLWDPWGNPYRIIIDSNYDGFIEHKAVGKRIRQSFIVFSTGPDGRPFTKDDIKTWEED